MSKTILACGFEDSRLMQLRRLCMMQRVFLRRVLPEEMTAPLGTLAGGVSVPASEEKGGEAEQAPVGEMMVLCGFSPRERDLLLASLRRSPLKSVALKAVLTPTNALWSAGRLMRELKSEHEALSGQRGASAHRQ